MDELGVGVAGAMQGGTTQMRQMRMRLSLPLHHQWGLRFPKHSWCLSICERFLLPSSLQQLMPASAAPLLCYWPSETGSKSLWQS